MYVVVNSHLDTQWNWSIQETIAKFIPDTIRDNVKLLEKYPYYQFNWEGAIRYMMLKEYYPDLFEEMKKYIDEGRWNVAGNVIVSLEMNTVSAESHIRQILYGRNYYKKEFNKTSDDLFMPDTAGFPYSLPTIAAHCGLTGFSSMKLGLKLGARAGQPIPFDVGNWEGPDGSSIIAAIMPGGYPTRINNDLTVNRRWVIRVDDCGDKYGIYTAYMYYGCGDRGGAPPEKSVQWLGKSMKGKGDINVIPASSDQMYKDLTPLLRKKLPRYKGELILAKYCTGAYSSQAALKRWNRMNELLAHRAEAASVISDWLEATQYPLEKLTGSWIRFLWHQFHDGLQGTSFPEAYVYSWNDQIISLNQFSEVLKDGVGGVARALDTQVQGIPIVVYNPVSVVREDIVEAEITLPTGYSKKTGVFDKNGKQVLSQITQADRNKIKLLFLANVPSIGFAVYDIRPIDNAAMKSALKITKSSMENSRYKVAIDKNGDIARIFDKKNKKELLNSPARLALFDNIPDSEPAWTINYSDLVKPPRSYVDNNVRITIKENGPVRIALEVKREKEGSSFIQEIMLTEGNSSGIIEIRNKVDWKTQKTLLKAVFPMNVSNPYAVYDLGIGNIKRSNNKWHKYEVPALQWADLTDSDGKYGIGIMNDCKYGWDKPNNSTLRLTLIHTPSAECPSNKHQKEKFADQATQDIGKHQFRYALTGHKGDWRDGDVVWEAEKFNHPLIPFHTDKHPGKLGKSYGFIKIDSDHIRLSAIKKAENSDEVIVRFQEFTGHPQENVSVSVGEGILQAREVTGAEEPLRVATVKNKKLIFNITPYQPRAFALKLADAPVKMDQPKCQSVKLPYNIDVMSYDKNKQDGQYDEKGYSIPAELVPDVINSESIAFSMGPREDQKKNGLTCRGQKITFKNGKYNKLYILASALNDTEGVFITGQGNSTGKSHKIKIQKYTGNIGQWDSRMVNEDSLYRDYYRSHPDLLPPLRSYKDRWTWRVHTANIVHDLSKITPGFIKRVPIAHVATHRHMKNGVNEPYIFCYFFKYEIDINKETSWITLPANDKIRIFSMTLANNYNSTTLPACLLYD